MQVERISADITLKHKPKTGTQAYNMRELGMTKPTFYRYKNQIEKGC